MIFTQEENETLKKLKEFIHYTGKWYKEDVLWTRISFRYLIINTQHYCSFATKKTNLERIVLLEQTTHKLSEVCWERVIALSWTGWTVATRSLVFAPLSSNWNVLQKQMMCHWMMTFEQDLNYRRICTAVQSMVCLFSHRGNPPLCFVPHVSYDLCSNRGPSDLCCLFERP